MQLSNYLLSYIKYNLLLYYIISIQLYFCSNFNSREYKYLYMINIQIYCIFHNNLCVNNTFYLEYHTHYHIEYILNYHIFRIHLFQYSISYHIINRQPHSFYNLLTNHMNHNHRYANNIFYFEYHTNYHIYYILYYHIIRIHLFQYSISYQIIHIQLHSFDNLLTNHIYHNH